MKIINTANSQQQPKGMTASVNMKKQGKSKPGENNATGGKNMNPRTTGKIISSGITQPHNAKKEGLGPNTDRNA